MIPSGDLFVYAKDLFVGANDGPLAPLHCWLICSCGLPDPPFSLGQAKGPKRKTSSGGGIRGSCVPVKAVVLCKEQGATCGSSLSLSGVVPSLHWPQIRLDHSHIYNRGASST